MKKEYDLQELMEPLWRGPVIRKESVAFLEENGFEAGLLYEPDRILKVESSDFKTVYEENRDYTVKNGRIVLTEQTTIPPISNAMMYPENYEEWKTMAHRDGGYLLFREGSFFHRLQTCVTYETRENFPTEVLPRKSTLLPRTMEKLSRGEQLRVVLYGDSISEGSNGSLFVDTAPYMPGFCDLTAELAERQGKKIHIVNTALGGQVSQWGVDHVEERVCIHRPDLVLLAFGMNDGTICVSPAAFRQNIETMKARILEAVPRCEFLLVASMNPNELACAPDKKRTPFLGTQNALAEELRHMTGPGTELLDMNRIHKLLLQKKRFCDMTGNNVNHPNDYLIRWYAQMLCRVLGLLDE